MAILVEKSQNRTKREHASAERQRRLPFWRSPRVSCGNSHLRPRVTSFKGRLSLSGRTLLPLLICDCQDFSGPPVCCASRRILGGRHKNRPVVTPHADVTSNQPEQEQDMNLLPQISGSGCVDLRTPAIRTIFQADSSHFPPGRLPPYSWLGCGCPPLGFSSFH
jgi:hypothetical protein